jgi:hypothetical protein
MANIRTATLSVNVMVADALKNLKSVTTSFQSLDKLGTKNLTSSIKAATSEVRGLSKETANAQEEIKDIGFTGEQAGGLIQNSMQAVKDSVGGLTSTFSGLKGALAGLAAGAVINKTIGSAMETQQAEQGAEYLAKQRGWNDEQISQMKEFINTRNDYMSKGDNALFAEMGAKFMEGPEEMSEMQDEILKLMSNAGGPLKEAGMETANQVMEGLTSGDLSKFEGILSISINKDLTADVIQEAQENATRAVGGGPGTVGWDEAFEKYKNIGMMQSALARTTKDMTIDTDSATMKTMAFNKSLDFLATTMGEQLLPMVTWLLDGLTSLIEVVGPTGIKIGAMGVALIAAAAAVGMLMAPMTALKTLMLSNPLGIMIVALATLMPFIYQWADEMGYIKQVQEWISKNDIVGKLSNLGGMAIKLIMPATNFIEPMIKLLTVLWTTLVEVFNILYTTYKLFNNFISWILSSVNALGTFLKDLPEKVSTAISTAIETVKDALLGSQESATEDQKKQIEESAAQYGSNALAVHKVLNPEDTLYSLMDKVTGKLSYKWAGTDEEKASLEKEGYKETAFEMNEDERTAAVKAVEAGKSQGGIYNSVDVKTAGDLKDSAEIALANSNVQTEIVDKLKTGSPVTSANTGFGPTDVLSFYWDLAKQYLGVGHATGGRVMEGGIAKLHSGETVLTQGQTNSTSGGVNVTMTINNPSFTNSSDMYKFDQHVRELINRENLLHMVNKTGRGTVA